MRRLMVVIGVIGCGDGGGNTTSATIASNSSSAETSVQSSGISDGDGSGGDASATGTSGEASGDQTGSGSGSSEGAASEGGASEGGASEGCQHAWDFSRCPQGWEVGKADPGALSAPSWACGDPSGTPALGGAHTGVWATNLSGDYTEDESSALTSPSFSLADCAGATIYLTFAHLYEFGSGDGGTVQVSTDGGTSWTTIEPTWHGYCAGTLGVPWSPPGGEPGFCDGDDETWLHSLASLDDLGGEPDVRVRFVMGSDGIIEQLGWYVDSVTIEAY